MICIMLLHYNCLDILSLEKNSLNLSIHLGRDNVFNNHHWEGKEDTVSMLYFCWLCGLLSISLSCFRIINN